MRRRSMLLTAFACAILTSTPAGAAASGPRNLEQPYVETAGRAEVGEMLSCYPGTWEGSAVTLSYEWQRDGVALASGPTHQITGADEGHWLSCVVSATDSGGTSTASSVDSFFINPPHEGPPPGGSLEGHVTDAASGQPIGGVKACAVNTDEGEPWDCVHTDASGHYKMTVAEAGRFIVQFTVAPHSPYIARTFYGGKFSQSQASVLTVAAGSTTTGVDVQLQEGGRITGTVTDALTGLPIEAVEVCARGSAPAECVWTNAQGQYTVSQLAGGSYGVEFGFGYGGSLGETYVPEDYDNLLFQASEPTQVSVSAGATATGIDAVMHHWAALTGRVTGGPTHTPVEGVQVDAYDGGQHTAVTNANGEYTIPHLGNRSGEYTVSFSPLFGNALDFFPQWYDDKHSQLESDPVSVPLDQTTSGIDAVLEEGGQIAGKVTNAQTGQAVAGIFACARNKVVYEARCANTEADGSYKIPGLPAGAYTVEFYSNSDEYFTQYYDNRPSEAEVDPVSVALDHTTGGIDAALEPVVGGVILGDVREAVWAKSLANIDVCAYELGQEELFGTCTTTNAEGEYSLKGLTQGEYLVEFASPGAGLEYATQFYDQRASWLNANSVKVTDGKYTPGIDGRLEQAGDASGRVVSAETGKGLQGIEVCYFARTEELVGCILTDATGRYSTPPLARGEYKVLFISPFESGLNYAAQFYGGVASINNSPSVTIEAGKLTTGIDAQMTAGGRIAGTVTSAGDGQALEGALVCALPGFGEVGECALTRAGGQYAIEGLARGNYHVLFEAQGYGWQYYKDVSLPSEALSIAVSEGTTSSGIDAALQPTGGERPRNLQPPAVSGSATVGDVLECSSGSWTGSPSPGFTYNWLRNGSGNVGSGATYRVLQADEGSSLQCEVTAANSAGSASALSNSVQVPPPTGTPPPPVPSTATGMPPPTESSPTRLPPGAGTTGQASPAGTISTSSAVYTYSGSRGGTFVSSGELARCPAGTLACQIVIKMTMRGKTGKVLLASLRLSVPAGEVERLRFKLDATGVALLHGLRRIHATIVSTVRRHNAKPVTVSRAVTLRSPGSHAPS